MGDEAIAIETKGGAWERLALHMANVVRCMVYGALGRTDSCQHRIALDTRTSVFLVMIWLVFRRKGGTTKSIDVLVY